jgi:hypothetical protein
VPVYRPALDASGLFIETQLDGTERRGRFVDRSFVPLSDC